MQLVTVCQVSLWYRNSSVDVQRPAVASCVPPGSAASNLVEVAIRAIPVNIPFQ